MNFDRYPHLKTLLVIGLSLLSSVLVLLLGGCQSTPTLPRTVTVTVERYKPLPVWAVEPLPKPEPANGTVGERVKTNNARGEIIDYANCRSQLLLRLDKGEAVNAKECAL